MICKSHNAIKPKFLTEKTCNFKKTIFFNLMAATHLKKSMIQYQQSWVFLTFFWPLPGPL